MAWGVFERAGVQHVVPTDDEGYARLPHVFSLDCPCHPRTEGEIVVHEEIQ